MAFFELNFGDNFAKALFYIKVQLYYYYYLLYTFSNDRFYRRKQVESVAFSTL